MRGRGCAPRPPPPLPSLSESNPGGSRAHVACVHTIVVQNRPLLGAERSAVGQKRGGKKLARIGFPPLLRSPQAPPSHSQSIPCRMLCTGRLCTSCRRRKRSKGVGAGQNRGTKKTAAIAPPAPRPAYLGFPLDLVNAVYTEGMHIGQSHGRSKNQGKIVRAGSNLERKEMAATRPRWRRICAICRNTCPACGDSST